MGVVDIAGGGPVHVVGGAAAFASAAILGPRLGRYANGTDPLPLGNPVNACMGLFVLWWGWLAFNSGSTYGISGSKWQYSARAAVITMMSSFGGGTYSLVYSLFRNDGNILDVVDLINGILGSLVSVTAGCFLYNAWEAIVIGMVGSFLVSVTMPIFDRFKIDDPVGACSVHGVCGIWGVIAIGLFADNPIPLNTTNGRSGLFKGGGWFLLGVQTLSAVCLTTWSASTTFFLLWVINKFIPIRMDVNEELLGADLMEHRIRHSNIGLSRALSALIPLSEDELHEFGLIPAVGVNPGHENAIKDIRLAAAKLQQWREYEETLSPSKRKEFSEFDDPVRNALGSQHGTYFDRRKKLSKTTKSIKTVKSSISLRQTRTASVRQESTSIQMPTVSNRVGIQEEDADRSYTWID